MANHILHSGEAFVPSVAQRALGAGPRNPDRGDEDGDEKKEEPGWDQNVGEPDGVEQEDEAFPPWRHIPGFEPDR